jgi:hypothetical protein
MQGKSLSPFPLPARRLSVSLFVDHDGVVKYDDLLLPWR